MSRNCFGSDRHVLFGASLKQSGALGCARPGTCQATAGSGARESSALSVAAALPRSVCQISMSSVRGVSPYSRRPIVPNVFSVSSPNHAPPFARLNTVLNCWMTWQNGAWPRGQPHAVEKHSVSTSAGM